MKIALVAPPFISVPPRRYGGTELYVAHLAAGLHALGHEVIVYANGDSDLPCEVRSLYPRDEWPVSANGSSNLKDLNHASWAVRDAAGHVDVIHLNNAPGLSCSRFIHEPVVHTIHHAYEESLSDYYASLPDVTYVTISEFQERLERMPRIVSIHHGLDIRQYPVVDEKQDYLCFLGRIAPVKGTHLAIDVAQRAGIPLKIAGEIQPIYREYWESAVKPKVDGQFIEYVGEADHATKVTLLGHSRAMLFPIQWNEPVGLVMIEAMACGTPVLALPGGSVPEVVYDGVSGLICRDVDDMARRAAHLHITPASCREHVSGCFSLDLMVRRYESLYRTVVDERRGAATVPADAKRATALAASTSAS